MCVRSAGPLAKMTSGRAVLETCHSVAAEATNLLPWPAGLSSMGFEMLNWSSSLARWTSRRGTPPPRPPATQHPFLMPALALWHAAIAIPLMAAMTGSRRETARSLSRRSMILPRVCKRWAAVLTLPSPVWERVDIDGDDLRRRGRLRQADQPLTNSRLMSTWFTRSGPHINLHSRHRQNVEP